MNGGAALWFVGAAAAAGVLVELVRRYAVRRGVLDIPNHRSSHLRPTPRGGGIGLLPPILFALLFLGPFAEGSAREIAAAVALALVAGVGWLDDHGGVRVGVRLGVHALAGLSVAWIAIAGMRPDPALVSGATAVLLVTLAAAWWVFWTVSAINVVNFMDGSDALIGLQGVLFGLYACLALPDRSAAALFALAAAGAFAGFLVLNRPPARIFMGDAGSGATGVVFVLLGLLVTRRTDASVVAAFLPLAPLFVDEVLTMYARVRRRDDLTEAHRSHYYQRLIAAGWSHGAVALLMAGLALPGAFVSLAWGGSPQALLPAAGAYILMIGAGLHGLTRRMEGAQEPGHGA